MQQPIWHCIGGIPVGTQTLELERIRLLLPVHLPDMALARGRSHHGHMGHL